MHFKAETPDRIWGADFTYVGTEEGWLYVALVMDLFSRRLVGWAMSEMIDGHLTATAFALALGPTPPLGAVAAAFG